MIALYRAVCVVLIAAMFLIVACGAEPGAYQEPVPSDLSDDAHGELVVREIGGLTCVYFSSFPDSLRCYQPSGEEAR